jgi:antirestriction protein ArdC
MKLTPMMTALVEKILLEMEKTEKMPWDMPWFTTSLFNWKSQKAYKGMNIFSLSSALADGKIKIGQFLTFKQAMDAKGTIKKGSHGFPVCYFTMIDTKGKNGEKSKFPFMKTSIVFSIDQTEGIKPREIKKRELSPNEMGEKIINNCGAIIKHADINQAFYSPNNDSVSIPNKTNWKTDEGYYSTVFHELGHWTGNKNRLDRESLKNYASERPFEELVAELTGAFLSSFIGYKYDTQHTAYLKSWSSMLKDHKDSLYTASSKAQKAVDYILEKAGLIEVKIEDTEVLSA